MSVPSGCLTEMKTRDREKLTVNLLSSNLPVAVLPCENYDTLKKLLRVTACLSMSSRNPEVVNRVHLTKIITFSGRKMLT